jgi:hypothetical protein
MKNFVSEVMRAVRKFLESRDGRVDRIVDGVVITILATAACKVFGIL